MTDGPGQQPPQEPRHSAADGEREVLEGRVIPSRQNTTDPRAQFRQQTPPPQAPEPGPAWSPQSGAAAQAQPGAPWSPAQGGQEPAPDAQPRDTDPSTQIIRPVPHHRGPAGRPPQGPAPVERPAYAAESAPAPAPAPAPQQPQAATQATPTGPAPHAGPQQPYAGQPQAPAAQQPYIPPQQQQPPSHYVPAQPYGAQPQQQAPAPAPGPQRPVPQQQAQQQQAPAPAPSPAPSPAPAAPSGRGGGSSPDWNALAEQQEASGARRKRVLMLTGGIVAVAVIAGGVATAVVMSGKSGDGKPVASPSSSGATTASQEPLPPAPSFSSVAPPPPANPLDYIGTAAKDKAPLTPDSLFPGKQFVWQGRTYAKARTDVTTSCAANARAALAPALTANGCQKLVRATYTNGALAVTVGVAVFQDAAHAKKVQAVSQYLAPLNGGGVASFCRGVRCQMASNAVGRYAYFAIAGYKNGTTLAANDTVGRQAANDASDFAFTRIVQRGKDAAAADPARR
ncbi:hypothetical protein [Streptomyces sp. NPDC020983]|uniref:hypothetical protein n=1 Tax=Streptomyces sp. NPDC020983 TaxID=3365106 RepID=UPI003791BED3